MKSAAAQSLLSPRPDLTGVHVSTKSSVQSLLQMTSVKSSVCCGLEVANQTSTQHGTSGGDTPGETIDWHPRGVFYRLDAALHRSLTCLGGWSLRFGNCFLGNYWRSSLTGRGIHTSRSEICFLLPKSSHITTRRFFGQSSTITKTLSTLFFVPMSSTGSRHTSSEFNVLN